MTQSLNKRLIEEFGLRHFERMEVPASISANINPAFPVRAYQQLAFKFFVAYLTEAFPLKPRQHHQLLMHMATGSGKTLMMAGMICYLYERGYRNFLFFVNSTNIIEKTRSNFLNPNSSKYLFAETISIGDKRVEVKEVSNFQSVSNDDINIVFSTIQNLHMTLNNVRENSLTYSDFDEHRVVLISDEAHHINADTKKGLDQEEMFEVLSWEGTVEKILKANPDNLLLEFTATVDLSDEQLSEKYLPRLLFDYPLKQFRKDGFSKEVKVLQSDLSAVDRALQAVLLSQYRRKIFEKNFLQIKPVILFKSKTIKDSQLFLAEFKQAIRTLDSAKLTSIQQKTAEPAVQRVFDYLNVNGITLANFCTELAVDFSEEKLISVNSKEESEVKQLAVNSLEDNEYRAVFAVDKLNEGWDVLNLFDIVRLYDTRDSKANKIGKTTMSEAQLIGRGARYCPFQLTSDQPFSGRKYDFDLDNELRVCEELYYHSSHNPKYIQELNAALQEIGMKPKETRTRHVRLKDSFKSTVLYKGGHIFLNERIGNPRTNVVGLDSSLITKTHRVRLFTGYSKSAIAFEAPEKDSGADTTSRDYPLLSFGEAVMRKAIQRLEFYEFSNLRKYLPNLSSINEFINSKSYLGRLKVEVVGVLENIENLSIEEKADIAVKVLSDISGVIASDKIEFLGSTKFKPKMLKDVFTDKTLNFMIDDGGEKEFGRSMNDASETSYHLDLSKRDWYVFDDCFGTSEEKLLIRYIDKRYSDLSKIFSDVYLLRNEKHFKLYAFDDGGALEPDFVLYLVGKKANISMHYQVFIEPKGSHLLKADEWKETFLTRLKGEAQIEQLFTGKEYVAWGMPFYNNAERMPEFEASFEELIP